MIWLLFLWKTSLLVLSWWWRQNEFLTVDLKPDELAWFLHSIQHVSVLYRLWELQSSSPLLLGVAYMLLETNCCCTFDVCQNRLASRCFDVSQTKHLMEDLSIWWWISLSSLTAAEIVFSSAIHHRTETGRKHPLCLFTALHVVSYFLHLQCRTDGRCLKVIVLV